MRKFPPTLIPTPAACLVAALASLCGCASIGDLGMDEAFQQPLQVEPVVRSDLVSGAAQPASPQQPEIALNAVRAAKPDIAFTRLGTEQFVGRVTSAGVQGKKVGDGAFTLNFQATDLLEVVNVFLADLLQVSYAVDPEVQGVVSLQTSRPLTRDQLLPTLEMLLRMNGAALIVDGDTYRVLPRAKALRGNVIPQLGDSKGPMPAGFGLRIVPLRHVAAAEMAGIIEPLATPGNLIRTDTERNLLIFAGSSMELKSLVETVEIFDVDWMAGMSVGLFTPDYVDVATLFSELKSIFEVEVRGPLENRIRFVPLERLNALLVVASTRRHFKSVAEWIERLDLDSEEAGQSLFVYQVRNLKAADLAVTLRQLFGGTQGLSGPGKPVIAPGLRPATVQSRPASISAAAASSPVSQPAANVAATSGQPNVASPGALSAGRRTNASTALARARAARKPAPSSGRPEIIADEANNALLIMGTRKQYRQVRAALAQLDVVPLQVLIEATIAEITLTDELRHGLEWFFRNSAGKYSGGIQLDVGTAGLAALAPGFSYALTDAAGIVRAVLNSLASDSRLNVVSSPSLMVLNNQEARIRVGDEVPIITQQQQSTATDANIINTIEFRETGVLLSVKPRVNPGGLVTMDIQQEITDVAPGTGASLTPTIQTRAINSSVAVQSGQTVVLGGLIRENRTVQRSGFPGLYRLPVVGNLFGSTNNDKRRTELVILITPRAIRDEREAARVTQEFREKMQSLKPPNGG